MRLTILQQDLWPVLQSVARSCAFRAQLPVLGNILISARDGELTLSATNLEIGVVKKLKASTEEDGELTVPAKTLVEVIGNLSGESIDLSAAGEILEVSTPSFSSKINGISAAEFPAIPLAGQKTVTIPAIMLTKSLPQVGFAAASDDGRPILTGILTEIKDHKLELVATDGYRLTHRIVPTKQGLNFKALVPKKTFDEVVRLLGEDSAESVQISTSDNQNQIIFEFGNTQLSSRLIEGQFPAWEKIVPQTTVSKIIVDRQELLKSVKLASVFARSEANVIKLNNSDGKLTLQSEAKDLGSQKRSLDALTQGDEVKIAFNAKYLQDALMAFNFDKVSLEFSGNLSAAVMRPVGDDGLEYIIMPVNIS